MSPPFPQGWDKQGLRLAGGGAAPAALTLTVLRRVPPIPQQCLGLEGLPGDPPSPRRYVCIAAHRPSQNTLLLGQVAQKWLQAAFEAPASMLELTASSAPACHP